MPHGSRVSVSHKRDRYWGERVLAAPSPTCSRCCHCVSEKQPIFLLHSPQARGLQITTPLWPAWDSSKCTRRENHTTKLLCVYFTKLPQKSKNHILYQVSGLCFRQCGSVTPVPRIETRSSASLYGKMERETERQIDREMHTVRGRDGDGGRETDRGRETEGETKRQRGRGRERQRQRQEKEGGDRQRERDRRREGQRGRQREGETERDRERRGKRERASALLSAVHLCGVREPACRSRWKSWLSSSPLVQAGRCIKPGVTCPCQELSRAQY